jgi:hypothetical protein
MALIIHSVTSRAQFTVFARLSFILNNGMPLIIHSVTSRAQDYLQKSVEVWLVKDPGPRQVYHYCPLLVRRRKGKT